MKVLWFSNTPSLADEVLSPIVCGGGWLRSLDEAIQEKIDLHIVFYHTKSIDSFQYGKSNYYPLYRKTWKLDVVKGLLYHHLIDQEDCDKYLAIIKKVTPDLIHIHGTENPFACIINKVNIPVVISIQGCITVIHRKYNSGIENKYLRLHSPVFKKGAKARLLEKSFFTEKRILNKMQKREERNLNKCRYIIGRTAWDKRVSSVLAPNSEYFHCDEILRNSFYSNIWEHPKHTNKYIIHTTSSSNSPFKGFETICETLTILHRTDKQNIEWRVAGISESDLLVKVVKESLKSRYPEKGLVLLGNLSEATLVGTIKEADLYVMPSHIENSPNSLCEAMIIGMPCIATFAGGTGSILKDGEEGILIQDGDPWALAGAVLELLSDKDKAIKYGENARIRALKRHDRSKNVTDLLNIYQEIINEAQRSRL